MDKDENWTIKQDSKKKGQELFYEQAICSKMNLPMLRCFSYCNNPTLEAFRCYADSDIRKQYDKNVNTYQVTEKLGTNLFIAYQSTNRIATVGPRDIYHYILQVVDRDNTTTCIFWPVEGRDVTPSKVRMNLPIGGVRFKPLGENDPRGKCEV